MHLHLYTSLIPHWVTTFFLTIIGFNVVVFFSYVFLIYYRSYKTEKKLKKEEQRKAELKHIDETLKKNITDNTLTLESTKFSKFADLIASMPITHSYNPKTGTMTVLKPFDKWLEDEYQYYIAREEAKQHSMSLHPQEDPDVYYAPPSEYVAPYIKSMKPSQIKERFDETVVGQERAKKSLAVAIYNHSKRLNTKDFSTVPAKKSNILLVGPTGSGKTLLAKRVSEVLQVPFVSADVSMYTTAGFRGKDLSEIVDSLIATAGSVEKAQRGVIFLDEVDKTLPLSENTTHPGLTVQSDLLGLIEGGKYEHSKKQIDTTNILFIFGGAFVGLKEQMEAKRNKSKSSSGIGFRADIKTEKQKTKIKMPIPTAADLIEYGMMPELMGRIPVIVGLQELNEKELIQVLDNPSDSIIKEYKELFAQEQVMLTVEPKALKLIAKDAIKNKTGARGLRSILESVLLDMMYKIPDDPRIHEVRITPSLVKKALKYAGR